MGLIHQLAAAQTLQLMNERISTRIQKKSK